MCFYINSGRIPLMSRLREFLNRKKVVVMIAYGGVGEFLFQLDLAKRFEDVGITPIILAKGKYRFFNDILKEVESERICLGNGQGWRYFAYMPLVWGLSIFRQVIIVNSFNSLYYRLPTRMFYGISKLFTARVIVCKHKEENLPYEQIIYKDEMVWERNSRIIEYITGKHFDKTFPVLKFKSSAKGDEKYIHIHPVGSILKKSYPVKKLIEVVNELQKDNKVVITLTPSEEKWYVTDELRNFVENSTNVEMVIKYFSIKEIVSLISNAQVFCTVNTGLLWLSLMIGQKVVVCDYFTDYEWNPKYYNNVVRLSHDFDKEGNGLHHVEKEHEDGTYFESMYLVTPNEVYEAISKIIK